MTKFATNPLHGRVQRATASKIRTVSSQSYEFNLASMYIKNHKFHNILKVSYIIYYSNNITERTCRFVNTSILLKNFFLWNKSNKFHRSDLSKCLYLLLRFQQTKFVIQFRRSFQCILKSLIVFRIQREVNMKMQTTTSLKLEDELESPLLDNGEYLFTGNCFK